MDKIIIKQLALNEGFKLKQQPDNTMELNPYVYIFADKLVAEVYREIETFAAQDAEAIANLKKEVMDKDLHIKNLENALRMINATISTMPLVFSLIVIALYALYANANANAISF